MFKIWRVIAAILLIGNIEFAEKKNNCDETEISNKVLLENAADVLQVEAEELAIALCRKVNFIQLIEFQ